jgi:uncharacterized protein YneF (UPF0154 family)
MNIKTVIIACLVSTLAGFAVGYYTGGEYIRRIYLRLNRRMTDDEIRKYQEMIYGKEQNAGQSRCRKDFCNEADVSVAESGSDGHKED